MSEITLKLKYQTENSFRILEMIKNYNSIFNLTYNFMFENENSSTKSILNYVNSKNNLFLDTYFKNGAIYDCKSEISKNKEKKIIFDKLENVQNQIEKSLEELDYKEAWTSLSELYYSLKKVKCKYRFSIEDALKAHQNSFSSKNFTKSFTNYICFD